MSSSPPAGPSRFRTGLLAFGRDVSVYGVQGVLLRVAQFALLPVYLAYLTPEDFGTLALATVFSALVAVFLGLGLDAAVLRFFFEWSGEERRRAIGTVWLFAVASALVLTILADRAGPGIAQVLIRQVPYEPYLRLTLWTTFFTSFEAIPLALLRCRQESGRYAVMSMGSFLLKEALKIYALVWFQRGVLGVLQGGLIASTVLALFYTVWMLTQVRLGIAFHYLRGPLRFSLPRIPGGVIDTVGTILDRILLEKYITVSQVGAYEVARRFGNIVRDVNLPLKTAWVPYVFRLAIERQEAPALIARISTYYLALLLSVALAVALLSQELVVLFGGPQYVTAQTLVPLFVLLALFDGLFGLLGTNVYIAKKTLQGSVVAAVSFAVLLSALLILVPRFQIPGAILALLLHRVVHTSALLWLLGRSYPVPYEWRKIIEMLAAGVAMFGLATILDGGDFWPRLMLRVVLAALFTAVVAFRFLNGRAAYHLLVARFVQRGG